MHLTNMIDPFLVEPYASIFSGPSTLRIAQMVDQGKIVYVDMPVADREQMARMAGTLMKLEYFREVRKRVGKKRPTFFLCDEFQRFFTTAQGKGDADEFEVTRRAITPISLRPRTCRPCSSRRPVRTARWSTIFSATAP